MANVNSNTNEARTGGPGLASTGAQAQTEQPDSQKGSAANPVGEKDYVEKQNSPDKQAGGKQPTDPVQND